MPVHAFSRKTPLFAAFFCFAALSQGCRSTSGVSELPESVCQQATIPIAEVQGRDNRSPMQGQPVTVRGVVTWVSPDAGVFLEEVASDADPATSNALFVESSELSLQLSQGDRTVVSGQASEIGQGPDTLTSLTEITGMRVCEDGVPLPSTDTRLPIRMAERESLEAMHVSFRQALAVTDIYRRADGRIRISANRILPAPTEVARPGDDARRQAGVNRDNSLHVWLDDSDEQQYTIGAMVMAAEGLMGNDGRYQQLWARDALPFTPVVQYRNRAPEADETRVVSFNLRNYFNGNGRGGGFPTARGAKTADQFERQRDRLRAAFRFLDPHVLAVQELENDGFGPNSAAQDLIRDLERATGVEWAVVNPLGGPVGDDEITVGLFFRPERLQAIGPGRVLASPPFQYHSRQPVAQAFLDLDQSRSFLVAVNHFKSKGSCPEDGPNADKRDGQGCWNLAREDAARSMTRWADQLAQDLTEGRALILGDLNAYRMADPIEFMLESGYKDLTASTGLRQEYSYVYGGQAGTLDHAFASPAMAPLVRSGRIMNINAGYPAGVNLDLPWLRSSDHDPVIVDLQLVPPGARK